MKQTKVEHPTGNAGGAQEGQAGETCTSPQLANTNKPQQPSTVNAQVQSGLDPRDVAATALKEALAQAEPGGAAHDARRAEMKAAQDKLKGVLLPPTFAGFGVAFEAALPQFERPKNNCWFRVRPDIFFDVLTFKAQDGSLLVALTTNAELVTFLASRNAGRPTRCYPYVYNDGTLGFWPVALDGVNGRQLDNWNKSAHLIAEKAKHSWKAIIPGKDSYQSASAPDDRLYGDPHFPEDLVEQFSRIIQGVLVENLEHPEMRRWQGLQ